MPASVVGQLIFESTAKFLRLDSTARRYWALLETPLSGDLESCHWSPLSLFNFPPESLFINHTLTSSLAEQHTVMRGLCCIFLLGRNPI
jgi:hypothetical protein